MRMMKVLSVYVLLFSSLVFAQEGGASMGGQTGSGGNGCWSALDERGWKTLEELSYDHYFGKLRYVSSQGIQFTNPFSLPMEKEEKIKVIDLTKSRSFRKVKMAFNKVKFRAPKTHKVLVDMMELFKYVHVINAVPRGIYRGDTTSVDGDCLTFSPAMMSFKNSTIFMFRPVVMSMDEVSANILIAHETFRLAQLLHPAFDHISDADLQHLTALLFYLFNKEQFFQYLDSIETRLVQSDYTLPMCGQADDEFHCFVDEKISSALVLDLPLGSELNKLRLSDPVYQGMMQSYAENYTQTIPLIWNQDIKSRRSIDRFLRAILN